MSATRTRRKTRTRTTPFLVAGWRDVPSFDGWDGHPAQEALVVGYGWVMFSRRLSAVWVKGEWRTNWTELPKAA